MCLSMLIALIRGALLSVYCCNTPHTNQMDFQMKTMIGIGVFVKEMLGNMGKEVSRIW